MRKASPIAVDQPQRSPLERAVGLAEAQFGRVSRRQLLAVGLSQQTVRTWLRTQRLLPVHPGVYALGHLGGGREADLSAALLYAGPGSALAARTNLWWRELLDHGPAAVQVDAVGRSRSRPGVDISHPKSIRREWMRGLPVTCLPEALLASADALTRNSMRLVLARAEFRKQLELEAVASVLGRGRNGSRALRAALESHLPQLGRCESPLEIDFALLCERFRIELPEPNERIGRWRPDMLWRKQRLVVELDGRDAHSSPAQLDADENRAAALRALGFTVIRFSWRDINLDANSVAADLRRLLG